MSLARQFNFQEVPYRRDNAVEYAHKWAFGRNPSYYNFDSIGGDCTNFVSQCIFAGSNVMNYDPIFPWYYINGYQKSPSWTGVEFLFQFLVKNKTVGPYGELTGLENILPGDIVQLSFFESGAFQHSGMIVGVGYPTTLYNTFIAAHTNNSDNRPLITYTFQRIRFIKMIGIRSPS